MTGTLALSATLPTQLRITQNLTNWRERVQTDTKDNVCHFEDCLERDELISDRVFLKKWLSGHSLVLHNDCREIKKTYDD